MTDRIAFLADRKKGIGGSDVASLFSAGYGCRRRLFYDKTNTPEDFPRFTKEEEKDRLDLGNHMEPFFADKYAKKTGRAVRVLNETQCAETVPHLRVNVDRIIHGFKISEPSEMRKSLGLDGDLVPHYGVLEIKSVGVGVFRHYKKTGLPIDYIWQLQAGMLAAGLSWGSFCIGCRDTGEIVSWDEERNETLCNEIRIEVPRFWETVEETLTKKALTGIEMADLGMPDLPPRLEPDDPRCQRCEFRTTCQGNALIQIDTGDAVPRHDLQPVLQQFDERKKLFDMAEELLDETKDELRDALGDTQAAMVGKRKVYFRPQAGKTLYDGKGLMEAYRTARKKLAIADPVCSISVDADKKRREDFDAAFPAPESFVSAGKTSRPLRIY